MPTANQTNHRRTFLDRGGFGEVDMLRWGESEVMIWDEPYFQKTMVSSSHWSCRSNDAGYRLIPKSLVDFPP
jgi:hypothetical protein